MNQLDLWRKIALEEMKAVLKPHGFKQSGVNFRKRLPDAWMVFNFQSSSWNVQARPMTVYGNIGLMYTVAEGKLRNPKQGPAEYLCHWRGRVPGNKGQASEIASDEETRSAGRTFALDGLAILAEVLRRYPTPASMLKAHEKNRAVDHDLSPWGHCWEGLLRKDLAQLENPVQEDDGVS